MSTIKHPPGPHPDDVRAALEHPDPRWWASAACRDRTDVNFFPEVGGSVDAARSVCRACPVAANCLADALVENTAFGVWGGTTPRQRRVWRRYLDTSPQTASCTAADRSNDAATDSASSEPASSGPASLEAASLGTCWSQVAVLAGYRPTPAPDGVDLAVRHRPDGCVELFARRAAS